MDEHSYIRAIHRHIPKTVHVWKVNARFRKGVPDCWYSGDRTDLWVEYKWLSPAPVLRFTPNLSGNQEHWCRGRHQEGRNIFVILGTPAGGLVMRDREWEKTLGAPAVWLPHKTIAQQIVDFVSSTPEMMATLRSDTS